MTSAEHPEKKQNKPKRKWLKRSVWIIVAALALLVVFHQPILMALIRFAAARMAASQHVRLKYTVEGRALSGLVFTNVHVMPDGRTPIAGIAIERASVTYSVVDLLLHGREDFIKTLEINNATVVFKDIDDLDSKTPGHSHLGADMHSWFFPPANLIANADIENLNIVNHLDIGDFELRAGEIHFQRGKPGWIRIQRMRIPNLRTWENVAGNILVTGQDITIENFRIAPDLLLEKVVSSAASGGGNTSRLTLQASIFGGTVSGEYDDQPRGDTFEGRMRVSATKFGLDGLGGFLASLVRLHGEFARIDLQCDGIPGVPSSWTGNSTASISSPTQVGPVRFDQGVANLAFKNGAASLDGSLAGAEGKVSGAMHGQLPDRLRGFPGMDLDGQFQAALSDLSQGIDTFTHGRASANGDFHLRNRELQTEFIATGTEIRSVNFDASSLNLKGGLAKPLDTGFPGGITGRITAQFKDARLGKYAFDSGVVTASEKEGWVEVDATDLKRAENTAMFNGRFQLPGNLAKIAIPDFNFQFSVTAPNAAAFNAEPDLNGVNGELQAGGTLVHQNDSFDGKIDIDGRNLVWGDFNAESLKAGVTVEKSVATLRDFQLVMNAKNQVAGGGSVNLARPFGYQGNLQANISDLTVFRPFFQLAGLDEPVGGALAAVWSGNGVMEGMHHSGQGQLRLTGGRYGNYLPITAEISGTYSPETIDFPTLHVHVDKTDFAAAADLRDTEFHLHDILLEQGKITLLRGELLFPVDLRTPTNADSLIPPGGRVFANLSSDEINLETLLLQPKQTSPFKGALKFSINADGPLNNLPADILLGVRNFQVKAAPSVAPGNLELDAALKDNQLALDGSFQQPAMTPLQISGKVPFSPLQVLRNRRIDEQSPIDLSLTLAKCPAGIFAQIEPRIRYIEGEMGIDARATGTIARPQLAGSVTLDLPAIRLRDPVAPAVNGFKGDLHFTGNQLVINRLGGEISGGPFNLTGRVLFEKLTSPTLDLRLTSENALLLRNETLTIRADSDLKISGIANAANVTGSIGLTKSRFFRDVEILPISLPGRPAPKPPTELQGGFSLKPPFAKWTFNVAIKTIDPVLVRGNLANGAAHLDLKLVGTGAVPALDGMAWIENFVASLPFSRLNVEYGYAYFSPDNPFTPTLDIQGTSSLRDYNIRVYISGTPSDPVTVLTSDPPLPQEEIVALLGTGATSEELTSNSDVLAGRAAILLLQDLYRKVFKHKASAKENQSFLTRFELNPGAIDPRTGRQEVSARFKATDQVYFIGDLDDQGGVRGQIGYLLRFR